MRKLNDEEFKQVWSVFGKYKNRFAFFYGSLAWGMPTSIIMHIINQLWFSEDPIGPIELIISTLIFLIIGYLYGLLMYDTFDSRYNKLTDT